MKKTLTILSVVLLAAGGLFAQSTKDLTMTVNLSAWYDLSLSPTSISFTDVAPTAADSPAAVSIKSNEGAVTVRAFAVTGSGKTLSLTVKANGDLTSGSNTIGIGAISWASTGSGYVDGAMATSNVTAGSWSGSILHWHEGSFTYSFLRDYTTQAPGDYTASATYTLSAV
ncbi:MAG: hypothetical protein BWX98_02275 [Candidatus Aminicenantes bacterium ADurb.Bin147]|nr:MAG: hypothetical protein BWX98_02275 [Candidatus Aminicenantes bacterium ADurb.Bin147]